MIEASEITKYPLDAVFTKAADLLAESEFLVERLSITKPQHYLSIRMSGQWEAKFGMAIVNAVFVCNKQQAKDIKTLMKEDGNADDLDSGIGEAFEAALSEVYPEREWYDSTARTKWSVEIAK